MRPRRRTLQLLPGVLLLCFIGTAAEAAGRIRLDDWTRTELVPYLTEQLTRHPRFRGERITIAALDGAAVTARIDGLTAQLRITLTDALLAQQGLQLSWDGANSGSADAACEREGAPGYFLGLDVADAGGDTATIKVRALDRQEQSFVPGFGLQWKGRLNRSELAALNTWQADESLRGQRELPYEDQQADLVAAHVAARLSCQLRRRGLDRRLSAPSADSSGQAYAQRIAQLVSNYLARNQHGASDSAPALAISARLHPIDDELSQLWVTASASLDGEALSALATDVYLRRPAALQQPSALLSVARLVQSTASGRCSDSRTWRAERDVRPVVSGWPATGCVALEVRAERSAYLFALVHPGDGKLQPLFPATCQQDAELEAVAGLRRFALTSLANQGAPASPSFYVVATDSRGDARELARHLRLLCRNDTAAMPAGHILDNWLTEFDRLLQRPSSDAEWRVVRTNDSGTQERT